MARRRERDPEKKKLRSMKRELRREWKKNKDSNCIGDLKKRFFKVTKILNIIRKQNAEADDAADFQKQTKSFRENPQKFAKKIFETSEIQEPNFDAQKAQDFFRKTYSDNSRGMTYQHPPNILRPGKPHYPFKTSPPTTEEIITSLSRKRNAAAPGPNGIPYLVYKKIPFLRDHLSIILQEMWPNFELPNSRYGITGLIYKSGPNDEVSNYRPVTMTNTDGKILLSVLATRSLSYMKLNGYYDLGIQKGFISDMAGCAEHTTMLSELLKNAKQTGRQITVCWTDLENAFGSLRHDLIQFALDWYHFPVEIKSFVYDYYEGLYIKVRTSKWITEPVALLMGIFQGCPLSVQLFNIVWNIALDMMQSSPAKGYKLKEAGIEKQQLSYVDDETIIASSPEDAQLMLDTLDGYLSWTECVRAKPRKCRALAFRVFKEGATGNFTPISGTRYSAYNPMLSISGQSVPFLGDEPFKFLGRKISINKDSHNRAEIKENFTKHLALVGKANITGPMKLWLYNNYIVAFITWPFMIYDLPISFGEELKAIATRNLKQWLGVTKTITETVLYRSKDHFGLGLSDLVTHLKKMQVCRMHMLKYSQDDSSRKLYIYMREKDKPPLNKLGIPQKRRVWKPCNALEKAERNIYLDNIAFGQHHISQVNKSAKMDRHNTLKRIERDDEEARLAQCYGYAVQGDWLNFDAVSKADLSWNSLIYSIPQELLKFLLNSTHNVLPTSDNLKRWGKTVVDMRCCLCGFSNPTLKHILNGCSMALKQGRYTWRHDSILLHLIGELHSFVQSINSCSVPITGIKDTFIKFVREGKQPRKGRARQNQGLLFTANDWMLVYDSPQSPLIIPRHIAQTSFRPDIIIYSNSTKQIFILELTVPAEDNIIQRHTDKEDKYARLLDDININQWTGRVFGIEVGSRGYVAKSFNYAMKALGVKQDIVRKLRKAVSLICLRCSYSIFLSRKNEIWRPWEAQCFRKVNVGSGFPAERNSVEAEDSVSGTFCGFSTGQIQEGAKVNCRRLQILHKVISDSDDFEGFEAVEIRKYKKVNDMKTDILKGASCGLAAARGETPLTCGRVLSGASGLVFNKKPKSSAKDNKGTQKATNLQISNKVAKISPVYNQSSKKLSGLINLGNSCYMNSVMQCLRSVYHLVKYFTEDAYMEDINPASLYNGSVAKEVGTAFGAMVAEGRMPVSLRTLKARVGELNHDYSGCGQNDSHEFLVHLFTWLHEDLRGAIPHFSGSPDLIPHYLTAEAVTSEVSVVTLLFQGLHKQVISCNSCHHDSVHMEPFTILTLPLPASGSCTLESLLENYHKDVYIDDYICPNCSGRGKGLSKTYIQKLPPILVLQLGRFEYLSSARKKQNYVNFPLENLSLKEHVMKGENSASYNLCAVSNHFGTLSGGHYTSYCKSLYDDFWYHCDDGSVTRLRKSVKSSAAYLLFYDSTGVHK